MARRQRPNHFLAIRLTDPALLGKLREVQDQLLAAQPSLRWGLVPLAEAHITLNVFKVEEEGLGRVRNLLRSTFQENKAMNPPSHVVVEGLGGFSARVLFAQPVRGISFLHQLQAAFKETLLQNNITTDTRSYNPHITLFKADNSSRDFTLDKVLLDQFKGFVFGTETVSEIQLLAMGRDRDTDGYFLCKETYQY